MNLKTLSCKKSIIKADLKRFWWVSVLYTILIFFTSVFGFLEMFYDSRRFYQEATDVALYNTRLFGHSASVLVFSLIVPVILAVLLFLYMQTSKASSFAHSVPVTRKNLYISHIASGIILMVLPLLFNFFIMLLMRFNPDFAKLFYVKHLVQIYGTALLYSFVSFSLASAVCMIAGNGVASLIFTYGFGFLPLMIEVFSKFFLSTQLFGYYQESEFWVFKYLYIAPEFFDKPTYVIWYVVLTLIFFVIGYLLYKLRDIENHSEAVAFLKLRKVFIYVIGVIAGCMGFAYFNGMWGYENALLLIPFGILGLVIATMIVKKSYRVLKFVYKPIIIYSALAIVLFLGLKYDVTGFEKRVPKPEDVKSIAFNVNYTNYNYREYYDVNGVKYNAEGTKYLPELSGEDVKKVTAFHQEMINNKDAKYDVVAPTHIIISYTLNNGKVVEREYQSDYYMYQNVLEPIIETKEVRQMFFPILREDGRILTNIEIYDQRLGYDIFKLNSSDEMFGELVTALKKDLLTTDYEEFVTRDGDRTRLNIHYKTPGVYADLTKVPEEMLQQQQENYFVRNDFENTLKVLGKYGLYDAIPNHEEIKAVGVNYFNSEPLYDEKVSVTEIPKATQTIIAKDHELTFAKIIDNKEDILKIYNYDLSKSKIFTNYMDIEVTYMYENGHYFTEMFSSKDQGIPEVLNWK